MPLLEVVTSVVHAGMQASIFYPITSSDNVKPRVLITGCVPLGLHFWDHVHNRATGTVCTGRRRTVVLRAVDTHFAMRPTSTGPWNSIQSCPGSSAPAGGRGPGRSSRREEKRGGRKASNLLRPHRH